MGTGEDGSIHFLKSMMMEVWAYECAYVSMGVVVRELECRVGSMGSGVLGQKCGMEAWNDSMGIGAWKWKPLLF